MYSKPTEVAIRTSASLSHLQATRPASGNHDTHHTSRFRARRGEPALPDWPGRQAQDASVPVMVARTNASEATALLSAPSLNRSYGSMALT
jgi:hypothetical protein